MTAGFKMSLHSDFWMGCGCIARDGEMECKRWVWQKELKVREVVQREAVEAPVWGFTHKTCKE